MKTMLIIMMISFIATLVSAIVCKVKGINDDTITSACVLPGVLTFFFFLMTIFC